ncbi:MAG TPA: RluA family pseudouridine synthase [Candidatus Avidesulfovibrio excrementigallinarum]|nr:RluA family pseudouridine synthase [Candidatus Avidesulfovibrio excrementigallinarum]
MSVSFRVSEAEAGQKLLQCLVRRVEAAQGELHRWIRTGQVRVNGGRRGPFDRLEAGDELRLPPFARLLQPSQPARDGAKPDLPVVWESPDLLVVNKPAGLPTHPGTGHDDSVVTRLHAAMPPGTAFAPTPAHRLDRDTSGVLLVARSYAVLRRLNDAFARHDTLSKEYLAWCAGRWELPSPLRLEDRLEKRADTPAGPEKMHASDTGRHAAMDVAVLRATRQATLLKIRLLTGRTHQIRVQLALRGHPILGDAKYGKARAFPQGCAIPGLLLHAFRLTLAPGSPDAQTFLALPSWPEPWRVTPGDIAG